MSERLQMKRFGTEEWVDVNGPLPLGVFVALRKKAWEPPQTLPRLFVTVHQHYGEDSWRGITNGNVLEDRDACLLLSQRPKEFRKSTACAVIPLRLAEKIQEFFGTCVTPEGWCEDPDGGYSMRQKLAAEIKRALGV